MNRKIVMTTLILFAAIVISTGSSFANGYTITDLGTLGGNAGSLASGINKAGQVVGYSFTTNNAAAHAFLYSNGAMTDLGTLPGGAQSNAFGINDSGQVVGQADTATGAWHAFLYSNGAMTDLGTLGGTQSNAFSINNAGQVVGLSFLAGGIYQHAFLYSNGTMTDLGTLGGTQSFGFGINNAGQVVGQALTATDYWHAFLYSNGVMTDLGTLPSSDGGGARAVNNAGQVVGYAELGPVGQPFPYHAFLYSNGTMTDLGAFPAGGSSQAYGINVSGQVVGYSGTFINGVASTHAFLYSNGTMQDLNDLIGTASGWTLVDATGINDNGQIVGNGYHKGEYRGFLLTPLPEGIVACNGVTLSGNAMVDSYNSTKGSYASQEGAGGHAGSDGNVQTLLAGANITLAGDAAIYGNASATGSVTTSGHAKVYGTTSQNQPTLICDPLNVASMVDKNRPLTGSPTSITLSGKETETLLTANSPFYLKGISLSGQSMLTITGTGNATMFIDGDLSIAGQASFIVTSGIKLTLYITGNISIAGGGLVNQGPSTDLIIYASASKGKQVALSGNAELGGVLYAPLSNISVTGNAAIMGEVWGMTITGSGNAGFHYDEVTMLLGW